MAADYQPNFFEGDRVAYRCKDCGDRYLAIRDNYGSFKNCTLLDFYSNYCYFGFRFISDGGIWVEGVENNEDLRARVNSMANLRDLPLICHLDSQDILEAKFDIGLLLDSYGYSDTPKYMDILGKRCGVSFISAPSKLMNEKLAKDLLLRGFLITPIYQGKSGQIIYKCRK